MVKSSSGKKFDFYFSRTFSHSNFLPRLIGLSDSEPMDLQNVIPEFCKSMCWSNLLKVEQRQKYFLCIFLNNESINDDNNNKKTEGKSFLIPFLSNILCTQPQVYSINLDLQILSARGHMCLRTNTIWKPDLINFLQHCFLT